MAQLTNKQVILGVTGGIAAYKSADLVRRLREVGADVRVVMTAGAEEFVTPLTFQAVSGNPVHRHLLDPDAEAGMGHIELARWADVILIAPTTADFMAKLAHGHADDLLSTVCLASNAPIAIAPAMNQRMWKDKVTQENVESLRKHDVKIFGPASGLQACGDEGYGRMLEPMALVQHTIDLFCDDYLTGKHIVVTAGPTREDIDPVRYLTNHSSGKMGYEVAMAAVEAGAKVTLVSGPVHLPVPERVTHKSVVSAQSMYEAVMASISDCDVFIAAAAVSDYRCESISPIKIKREADTFTLTMVRNPDILVDVAALPGGPFTVGFAAETNDVLANAEAKLECKAVDVMVANQVGLAGQGFEADNNALTVIWPEGKKDLPLAAKSQLARNLMILISERYAHYEKSSS